MHIIKYLLNPYNILKYFKYTDICNVYWIMGNILKYPKIFGNIRNIVKYLQNPYNILEYLDIFSSM